MPVYTRAGCRSVCAAVPVYIGGVVWHGVPVMREVLGVRVKPESRQRLDELARRLGVDRSEVTRRALAAGVVVLEQSLDRHRFTAGDVDPLKCAECGERWGRHNYA
jgi:predicted transcriptional regulator